ncbi:GntR family transcriptional regulator [Porticoccus sp. GXU_MW_L64]
METQNADIISRVYDDIKQRVMHCQYRPGDRLCIDLIAEELRVSATPVRSIMNRLVSEGFLILVPKVGFFMKNLSETEVRDMYEFLRMIILNCSDSLNTRKSLNTPHFSVDRFKERLEKAESNGIQVSVDFSNAFFTELSVRSGNELIVQKTKNLLERLYYIRCIETELHDPASEELLKICDFYNALDHQNLRQALDTYFESRFYHLLDLCKLVRTSFEKTDCTYQFGPRAKAAKMISREYTLST